VEDNTQDNPGIYLVRASDSTRNESGNEDRLTITGVLIAGVVSGLAWYWAIRLAYWLAR
jgi:hypothetical protein